MYRFGICDDDKDFSTELERILEYSIKEEGISAEFVKFSCGKELLNYIESNTPLDLLFLDIVMEDMDGVQVGEQIRNHLKYEIIQIVYVSSREEYAMQLFQNRPLDFLIKPIKTDDIKRILSNYMRIYSNDQIFFEFQIGKYVRQVFENEIMYFQMQMECTAGRRF